ncbi:hypothetical protein CDD81_5516 [Ophiocordyceps australis]|uniref:Uncharacterized protein n=1 Tax=Ophiocordyceps australis TaxID=1399860 RepID=A0A2C5YA42_9HYPO|nr:hypothetical protein CDD81_5516 [Ophiocordyceps australis]
MVSLRSLLAVALAGLASAQAIPSDDDVYPIVLTNTNVPATATQCTTVLPLFPHITLGPTRTVWTSTATATQSLDCAGCSKLTISYLPLGVPPVAIFHTTVTAAEPTTTTVLACGS